MSRYRLSQSSLFRAKPGNYKMMISNTGKVMPYGITFPEYYRITCYLYKVDKFRIRNIEKVLGRKLTMPQRSRLLYRLRKEGRLAGIIPNKSAPKVRIRWVKLDSCEPTDTSDPPPSSPHPTSPQHQGNTSP